MISSLKRVTSWVITLAALMPFIVSPHLFSDYVAGKTVFIRGLVFLIIALSAYAAVFQKNMSSRAALMERIAAVGRNKLFIAIVIGLILLGLSTVFAYDKTSAFFGELTRAEGFLTIFAFVGLFFAMAVTFGKKEWDGYFFITALAGIVTFGITAVQAIKGGVRPDALVGNPIYLATYFIFTLTAGAYIFIEGRKAGDNLTAYLSGHRSFFNRPFFMYFGIVAMVASLVGMFLTQSRGALLSIAIALVVVLAVAIMKGKERRIWKKDLRFWSAAILLLVIAAMLSFSLTRNNMFWQKVPGLDRIASSSVSEGTIASRAKLTQLSLNGFFRGSDTKTMLIGWGWDNYIYFFEQHYDPAIYQYETATADRAHNKLVDVLVMSGIAGLIAYLAVWFFLFKYAASLLGKNLGLGLVALFFLSSYFVNNLFAFDVAVSYLAFYSIAAYLVFTRLENFRIEK